MTRIITERRHHLCSYCVRALIIDVRISILCIMAAAVAAAVRERSLLMKVPSNCQIQEPPNRPSCKNLCNVYNAFFSITLRHARLKNTRRKEEGVATWAFVRYLAQAQSISYSFIKAHRNDIFFLFVPV